MVLLSETLSVLTAVLATAGLFRATLLDIFVEHGRRRVRQSGSYALLMLVSYGAVRLLLEVEPKQAVGPVYIAAVSLTYCTMPYGAWTELDWFLRSANTTICLVSIILFLALIGLKQVAQAAKSVKLDLEVKWYHVILANFTSLRWLFILIFSYAHPAFPDLFGGRVRGRNLGVAWLPVLVAVLWVALKATGARFFPVPWGMYDAILVEGSDLLNLIFALLTVTLCVDHVSDFYRDPHGAGRIMKYKDFVEHIRDKLPAWKRKLSCVSLSQKSHGMQSTQSSQTTPASPASPTSPLQTV